jgi:hypothetical protein
LGIEERVRVRGRPKKQERSEKYNRPVYLHEKKEIMSAVPVFHLFSSERVLEMMDEKGSDSVG